MPLPPKYQKAISQRQKQIDSWQKTVKESGLAKEQRREFQKLVESRFHVWLSETGHKRELDSLVVPLQNQTLKKWCRRGYFYACTILLDMFHIPITNEWLIEKHWSNSIMSTKKLNFIDLLYSARFNIPVHDCKITENEI